MRADGRAVALPHTETHQQLLQHQLEHRLLVGDHRVEVAEEHKGRGPVGGLPAAEEDHQGTQWQPHFRRIPVLGSISGNTMTAILFSDGASTTPANWSSL
ncbi:hypothetical protein [Streptomyces sp. NPDC005181]|uniref:hypothetical protein n=1 Tax=Streptomyces sp. NPDC005181 TaxID=3156869 RepID=UPI0033BB7F14